MCLVADFRLSGRLCLAHMALSSVHRWLVQSWVQPVLHSSCHVTRSLSHRSVKSWRIWKGCWMVMCSRRLRASSLEVIKPDVTEGIAIPSKRYAISISDSLGSSLKVLGLPRWICLLHNLYICCLRQYSSVLSLVYCSSLKNADYFWYQTLNFLKNRSL